MDYEGFKEGFYKLTSIQLHYYKEKQMKRRIETLIERKGFAGYESYLNCLISDGKELVYFIDYITINVTEFFRTPAHWEYVESEVFSKLHPNQKIRVWCCACSTGEEPYSVAMCLADYVPLSQVEIIATDLDETILAKARRGYFDERAMATLPDRYCSRYFTKQNSFWSISEEIKECVSFRQLDLLKDEYPSDCDLILCRNVLIYFTEEAKDRVYTQFSRSLKPAGCLFTGDTEQIIYHKQYGFIKEKSFLYRPCDH